MRKTTLKLIALTFVTSLMINSYFAIINGFGAEVTINPLFGRAPVIDGKIDTSNNEWNRAVKDRIHLFANLSQPVNGLPVDIWTMQNGSNLYISIQFSLESHNEHEFVGLLIARNASELTEDFKDAKIVQFINISSDEYQYKDFFIKNSVYNEDSLSNGNGAAKLVGDKATYEFVLPVEKNETDIEDVFLLSGDTYAFKVVLGGSLLYPPSFPDDFMVSNIVLIKISYFIPKGLTSLEVLYLVFSIIIFGTIGALYIFYLYRIVKIKGKIERIRI